MSNPPTHKHTLRIVVIPTCGDCSAADILSAVFWFVELRNQLDSRNKETKKALFLSFEIFSLIYRNKTAILWLLFFKKKKQLSRHTKCTALCGTAGLCHPRLISCWVILCKGSERGKKVKGTGEGCVRGWKMKFGLLQCSSELFLTSLPLHDAFHLLFF